MFMNFLLKSNIDSGDGVPRTGALARSWEAMNLATVGLERWSKRITPQNGQPSNTRQVPVGDCLTAGVVAGSRRVSTGSVAEITRHDSTANAEVGQMNVRPVSGGINQVSPLATCWRAFA